jgi:hypothetical protein
VALIQTTPNIDTTACEPLLNKLALATSPVLVLVIKTMAALRPA